MNRRARWLLGITAFVAMIAILAISALRSQWFRDRVRERLVYEVERVTGGRVEIGSFHFDWAGLVGSVNQFVLRGKEAPERAPLFRAERIELHLKIVSLWRRDIDLRELRVIRPEVHIYVAADGTTNLPSPQVPRVQGNPVQTLLRLAIGRLVISDGVFGWNDQQTPLDLQADRIQTTLDYQVPLESGASAAYTGALSAGEVRLLKYPPASLETNIRLEAQRVQWMNAKVTTAGSQLVANGSLENWREPKVESTYSGNVTLSELGQPGLTTGTAEVEGNVTWSRQERYRTEGKVIARGLSVRQPRFNISGIAANIDYEVTPGRVVARGARIDALGGHWTGSGIISNDFSVLRAEGELHQLQVNQVRGIVPQELPKWNGVLSGPVLVEGQLTRAGLRNFRIATKTNVEPAEGQLPIRGEVNLNWDQRTNRVDFASSSLTTPGIRLNFQGALGEKLEVGAIVTDLEEVEPVAALVGGVERFELPVRLQKGEVRFNGSVSGNLQEPRIEGKLQAANVLFRDQRFQRVDAGLKVSRSELSLNEVRVEQNGARAAGEIKLQLANWRMTDAGAINGAFGIRNLNMKSMVAQLGGTIPAEGTLSGSALIEGAVGNPVVTSQLQVVNAALAEERFKQIDAQLRFNTGNGPDALRGSLTFDGAKIELDGTLRRTGSDWRSGILHVRTRGSNIQLERFESLQARQPGLRGNVQLQSESELELKNGQLSLRSISGTLTGAALALQDRKLGDFRVEASTRNNEVDLVSSLNLPQIRIRATATAGLDGSHPVKGTIEVPPLNFSIIRDIAIIFKPELRDSPWPVRGFVEGGMRFQGPLSEPEKLSATIALRNLVVRPTDSQIGDTQMDPNDLTLRLARPVEIQVDAKAARIQKAEFVAKETDLTIDGSYSLNSRVPWDLRLNGSVNLAVLTTVKRDLIASGSSTVNATIRGAAAEPQLSGQMEIRNASFYLRDIPNGIDQASGTILFERNRANIQKLTGQTGGGTFAITGFLGLSQGLVTYRLQAEADRIRVRYPEGVSTTVDADLALSGSSVRSVLSGNVTILRSSFNPRSDFASLLASSTRPQPPPGAGSELLSGVQFDVRVRTSPNAEFQTSYTRDIELEADLRLRGSPTKPILLGRSTVSRGEIQFFGNKYTIQRGEVLFYNTAVIEPAIDLDLETRIRGIDVTINFAGQLNKLNVTYRSDPPLQTSEIVALLTVGRVPDTVDPSGQFRTQSNQNMIGAGSNALLGTALTGAVSSRLERFFGVSRIKIDPQLQGLDNVPQARLTVEQQISRDITLTFVTNLSRTQQQVVRLEWNLSREWSVVAVRDENGLFGIDFLLRKRLR